MTCAPRPLSGDRRPAGLSFRTYRARLPSARARIAEGLYGRYRSGSTPASFMPSIIFADLRRPVLRCHPLLWRNQQCLTGTGGFKSVNLALLSHQQQGGMESVMSEERRISVLMHFA